MARKKVYTDALNNIIGYDSSRIKNASRTLNLNTPQQTNNAATFDALRTRRLDNSLKQQSNLLSEKELLHEKFYDNNGSLNVKVKNIYGMAPQTPPPVIFKPIGNNNTGFVTHYIGTYPNGEATQTLLFPDHFIDYWDSVTPGNVSKWRPNQNTSSQSNSGTFRFNTKGSVDYVYNYALSSNLDFYWHTLLWGNTQGYPQWLPGLSEASTKEAFDNWCSTIANKYPQIKGINVLNEPYPSQSGTSMLKAQLGGAGVTGHDWIIYVFERAKHYFPNALRYLNDFGTLSNSTRRQYIIDIAKLSKDRDLISGIGIQGHYFTTDPLTRAQITTALDDYKEQVGLPLYITELDLSGQSKTGNSYNTGPSNFTEDLQLQRYQVVFPALYDHPSVERLTLWGYITTETWRYSQGIDTGLINRNGTGKRQALNWLEQNYLSAFSY